MGFFRRVDPRRPVGERFSGDANVLAAEADWEPTFEGSAAASVASLSLVGGGEGGEREGEEDGAVAVVDTVFVADVVVSIAVEVGA